MVWYMVINLFLTMGMLMVPSVATGAVTIMTGYIHMVTTITVNMVIKTVAGTGIITETMAADEKGGLAPPFLLK